jgi:hypothetical protein
MTRLATVGVVGALIQTGRPLLVAGHEDLLRQLPRGAWVGGTIPYFMTDAGGVETDRELLVTELPPQCRFERVALYEPERLAEIPRDYPENGVSFIVLPAGGQALSEFARQGPSWPGFFDRPLVGWVAGVALDQIGLRRPLVFDGTTGRPSSDAAVVLHVSLEAGWCAKPDIINVFSPAGGDAISFEADGFSATHCFVNGEARRLVDHLEAQQIDQRLPLIADFSGAAVNVSIQSVDRATGEVKFFAPVVAGVEYRFAAPLASYPDQFRAQLAGRRGEPVFSCNCVLNYLYANLSGEQLPGAAGPFTFGEIAWMLLNQTVVYLTLERTSSR